MKKTYMNPKMEVVRIETQQMLALSTSGSTNEESGNLARELNEFEGF